MDGATFWAQKRDIVKSADSSPQAVVHPTQQMQTAPKKSGLVLKDVTNGKKAFYSAVKKTDWADSDEDEDFLNAFGSKQDSQVATLQSKVASKDAQIDELAAVIAVKDVRIEELETTVQEKVAEILHLEAHMAKQGAQLETFGTQNEEQYLHVKELVAEVDEKDRRIEKLEAELDEKGAMISTLEEEIAIHIAVCSPEPVDTPPAEQVVHTEDGVKDVEEVAERPAGEAVAAEVTQPDAIRVDEPPEADESVKDDGTSKDASPYPKDSSKKEVDEPRKADEPLETEGSPKADGTLESSEQHGATSSQSKESSKKKAETPTMPTGPKFGDSDFPLFVTAATLKVVPLAPKPKTMSFPIDLSKYGKKSDQKSPISQLGPKKDKAVASSTQIVAPEQPRGKSDVVPDFNPSMDIRQMEHSKRVLYGNGPQITVMLGETVLATLPKYVLMQCSGKGYKHFMRSPDSTSITFPADSMDIDAAKSHLAWMVEMTYQGRVYSVTLNTDAKFDVKNLNICRAARVLGLNNTYVGHFTKQLCDRIRDNDVSFDFMEMVCDLAYPENDPVFDCLANNLVNQRLRGTIKHSEEVAALSAKHENLKKKMGDIEKRVQNKLKDNPVSTDSGRQHSDRKSRGASKDRKISSGARVGGGN